LLDLRSLTSLAKSSDGVSLKYEFSFPNSFHCADSLWKRPIIDAIALYKPTKCQNVREGGRARVLGGVGCADLTLSKHCQIRAAWERGACRASYGLQGPEPYISTARRVGAVSRTDTGPTYVIFGTGSDMPRAAECLHHAAPLASWRIPPQEHHSRLLFGLFCGSPTQCPCFVFATAVQMRKD